MRAVAVLAALVCAVPAFPQPLPAGPAQFTLAGAEPITVFTYRPPGYADGPLLVVFHGVGRNAADYRDHAIGMARRFKALVALFSSGTPPPPPPPGRCRCRPDWWR